MIIMFVFIHVAHILLYLGNGQRNCKLPIKDELLLFFDDDEGELHPVL